MTNPWAPKSAYDEADEPVVARARRWHGALYALFFVLGFALGYVAFQALDGGFAIARIMWLYGGDEPSAVDRLLGGGVLMIFFGALLGELGNALWLLMCRYRLRLSAAETGAALRSPSIPSFVLARLYKQLYERES